MTDIEDAHFAGFMEGIELGRRVAQKVLLRDKGLPYPFDLLNKMLAEMALEVSHRMEDAGGNDEVQGNP